MRMCLYPVLESDHMLRLFLFVLDHTTKFENEFMIFKNEADALYCSNN